MSLIPATPWKNIRTSAPLLLLLLLLHIPATVSAWPMDRATEGRSNFTTQGEDLIPPLGVLGQHLFGSVGLLPGVIADSNGFYAFGDHGIVALDQIDDHESATPYSSSEVRWEYRPMEGRDIAEEGIPSLSSDVVLAGMMVVVPKTVMGPASGESTLSLVGLHRHTGEEVWRHTVGSGTDSQLLVDSTGTLLFFYLDTAGDPANLPRMIRIQPGADEPTAVVDAADGLAYTSGSRPIAGSGNRVVLHHGREIYGLSMSDLGRRWTHEETEEDHGSFVESSRQDLIHHNNNAFVALGRGHVYSLGFSGDLRWATTLDTPDSCGGNLNLSMSSEGLVVSGLCNNLLLLLDEGTGEELWRVETPDVQPIPPVVHRDRIHLPTLVTGTPEVLVYDLGEGELLERFALDGPGAAFMSLAYINGHLVGVRGGLGADQALTVVEMEPASVSTVLQGAEQYPCGSFAGTELDFELLVENDGPGTARDARIELRGSIASDYTVTAPSGVEVATSINGVTMEFGDIEPSTSLPVFVTVAPRSSGMMTLETEVDLGVRNAMEDQGRDEVVLEVAPAPPSDARLEIAHVEVTQGIQDLDNSVPLVARKPTLIRVYPEADEDIGPVQAQVLLTGLISGPGFTRSYTDEPAVAIQDCIDIRSDPPGFRSDLGTSFNFLVPPEMLEAGPDGSWDIDIVLDPEFLVDVEDRSGFSHTLSINFEDVPPVCIVTRSLLTADEQDAHLTAPNSLPRSYVERAVALLPVHNIMTFPRSGTLSRGNSIVGTRPFRFDQDSSYDTHRMLLTLEALNILSSRPDPCREAGARVLYYGLVHEDSRDTGRWGVAYRGKAAGAVRLGIQDHALDYNNPRSGMVLAHEMAHNFDRRHVDCGGPDSIDSDYPYDPCHLGPVSSSSYFGADLIDPAQPFIIDPGVDSTSPLPADLLSYGPSIWISDYTYRGIFDELVDARKAAAGRREAPVYLAGPEAIATAWMEEWKGASGKEIIFSAVIDPDGDGEIEMVLPVEPATMGEEARLELALATHRAMGKSTGFAVELLDGDDDVLLEVPLELGAVDDTEAPEDHLAMALIPDADGLAALRVVRPDDGSVVTRADRSPNAPEAELFEPRAGDVVEDELTLHWEAADPDGNPVTTAVQYSHDNGETWTALTNFAGIPPVTLDARHLPGGVNTALIRLIVSDGFNATEVVSDPFTVVPRDPMVRIASPADGTTFHEGTPIFVLGDSFDPEDGPLDGDALSWHVDGMGDAGTGRTLLLTGLPRGTHQITLEATDSDGHSASDQIDITILPPPASTFDISRVILGRQPFAEGLGLDRNLDGIIDSGDLVDPETEGGE